MSYRLKHTARVSVQRKARRPAHITETKARANGVGRCPRGKARVEDTEPSLLRAVAFELSKIEGGAVAHHMAGARRVLEEAFRAVEQQNGVAARCERSPHAA